MGSNHRKSIVFICFVIMFMILSCSGGDTDSEINPGSNTPANPDPGPDTDPNPGTDPDPAEIYNGPLLPMGMNLPGLSYYSPGLLFTDVMTTASKFITFYDGFSGWDSKMIAEIDRDTDGYPTSIPQVTSDGENTRVLFLINNYYKGKFRILFDGEGTLGRVIDEDGKYYVNLNGDGGHVWITILESTLGNHIRNIRILPLDYENGESYPTFNSQFIEGLKPFHTLRFMDWIHTNNSTQVHWSDRITRTSYTQGGSRGVSFDYAIELVNQLDTDAWVCVPHLASDDYIEKMAILWRDGLESERKIYLEYSNEIWNWQFEQSGWILRNAVGAVDTYVSDDLAAIGPAGQDHPEKDAYMMARTFRIWTEVFKDQPGRLVRVATGQHAWVDNTRRILKYLFETDPEQIGCDAMSVGGYFNFTEEDHDLWLTQGALVSTTQIIDAANEAIETKTGDKSRETAAFVNSYGVDYLVYEGGQHMQPWLQGDWSYNQALWDAQIHPGMYDLYGRNFKIHTEPEVDCKLFMAFSYVGSRESKYGSWGHLETLSQIGGDYMITAPKYQALLDANEPK